MSGFIWPAALLILPVMFLRELLRICLDLMATCLFLLTGCQRSLSGARAYFSSG